MKRQHLGLTHQYGAASNTESQSSRPSAAQHQGHASSNPVMYSSLHQIPHSSVSHQLYSQPLDHSSRFDPRAPMVSSLQRAHLLSGSSIPVAASQPFQNRRVSLLRDIGRAGERDRDLSSTSSSTSESVVGYYSHGATSQRIATPPSQLASSSESYERPAISIMANLAHSNQQQQQQHYSETVALAAKQQDAAMKSASNRVGPQPNYMATGQQATSGIQRPSNVPTASGKLDQLTLPPGFEQKSKEDLVQAMDKVDKELSKVSAEIARLQKRKTQLEESAKNPPEQEKEEEPSQDAEPKPRDLWQIIYAENRKKAESARTVLDGICPIYDMPLYNQPCDTKVFQENLKKNEEMRPKLLKFFQHRRKLSNIREKYLCAKYDQMMETWQSNTEKTENNVKRKAKEAKTREYFEKLFPEIRKQREQQERVERVGTRGDSCRSDADFADIVDGLSEQEVQLQRMRQLAVVPPMLLDKEERRVVFINNNGFIMDPFSEFKESQQLDAWADHEKSTFKEKYVQHPKNFNAISSFIEKKSVADCILYYYLTKKANNFKALVRKQTLKPRKPKSGRAHTSNYNDQSGAKNAADKSDKDDAKKDVECEVDEVKIDKPPSPRMTRARKQTMNWTEEEINKVKEGFGKHGRDFSSISRMVTNKSEQQVKNFYHNYKKKHGLDQLIIESKKRKAVSTRSRHTTLSPDVTGTPDDDTPTSSRKTAESPSVESKHKAEKDKVDDALTSEKPSKERVPSPAVTSTKADASDATTTAATTHIRTRRTAALAAAAANQETQEKESTPSKRPGDKNQSSGEPVEKKAKKNERKSRSQKTAEQTLTELAKSEAVKDVVASLSGKSPEEQENEENPTEPADQKKVADAEKSEVEKHGDERKENKESEKSEAKKTDEPTSVQKQAAASAPGAFMPKKASAPEDHDSSATCSADEDAHPTETATKSLETKNVSSPYGFDDDFNDSPTRIRLELGRNPDAPRSLAASATTQSIAETAEAKISNAALNLVSKPVIAPMVMASVSIDARPQSLPPASMVAVVSSTAHGRPPATVSPLVVHVSGMDLTRPSSTPVYADFPKSTIGLTSNPTLTQPFYGQAYKSPTQPVPLSKAAVVVSTLPVNVKNIGELTYTSKKTPEKKSPISSSLVSSSTGPAHHTVVDLTKEKLIKQQSAVYQRELIEGSGNIHAPSHPYHMVHSMAASAQKDTPSASLISSTVSSVPTSVYARMPAEKDKQAKDRPPVVPDTAIPVSSLRFTSTSAKSLPVSQHAQYRAAVPTPTEMGVPVRQVKEEAKQPAILPVLPSRMSYSPKPNVPTSRTATSVYSAMVPSSVSGPRPPMPMEKAAAKHVTISGGSITQGKPVFRASTSDAHGLEKDGQKFAPPISSTPKAVLLPGAPSPAHTEAVRKAEEAALLANPTLLQNAILRGMPLPPGLVLSPSIKLEKSDSHQAPLKTFIPDDLRHSMSVSGAGSLPLHVDPHHLLAAGASIPQFPVGSAMLGLPMKAKGVDENLSPRSLMQRTTPPPSQSKLMERKSSHPHTPQDLPPRRPSPLVQHTVESHYKEDPKRPSSASRATPERRGMAEKPGLMSHHRMASNPHLHTTPKQRSSGSGETKPPEESLLHAAAPLTEQQQQQFLAALLGIPTPAVDPMAFQALIGQYAGRHPGAISVDPLHAAFAAGNTSMIRPYSTFGFEHLEKSRHSVLSQDFATAQQLMQQHAAVAAATARLPHPVSLLQAGVVSQGQGASATPPPVMIPPRHADSPASMERLNFIPQHGTITSPLTSRASPHRNEPSRTPTNPQSPLSPHLALKGHLVPGLVSYPGEGMVHPSADRRPSRSPHVASPGSDHRSLPIDARQPSPLVHVPPSIRHPAVSKSSHSMPEGFSAQEQSLLATFGGSTPHLLRQTTSPLSQPGRMKAIKQERSGEQLDSSRHLVDLPHRYHSPPDQLPRAYPPSDPSRSTQRWEPHRQTGSPMNASQKRPPSKPAAYSQVNVPSQVTAGPAKELLEKQATDQAANVALVQQERAVNDLKTKGRTKMTTGLLINSIIDHNINQFYFDNAPNNQEKTKQKPPEGAMHQIPERKPSSGKVLEAKAPESRIDPKMNVMGVKEKPNSVPTRTTTLYEHSSDIISNMYGREPTKPTPAEAKSTQSPIQDDSNAVLGHRFFNVLGSKAASASEEHSSKRAEASGANILIPTLTPQLLSNQDGSFESIIRKALMSTEASPVVQSPPIDESVRRNSTSGTRPGIPFHLESVASTSQATYQTSPQHDGKRVVEPPRFGSNSPAPSAPPQMFSALSFRTPAAAAPQKQMMTSSNIPGRSVLPGASTPAGVSGGGVYHPQAAPPPPERAPLPSNQYEPLSDDEN